jgi:hypothetical protein
MRQGYDELKSDCVPFNKLTPNGNGSHKSKKEHLPELFYSGRRVRRLLQKNQT